MPVAVKAEVEAALRPYHRRIRDVVERSWAEWLEYSAYRAERELGPVMYARTAANHIFDAIARNAIRVFASDNTVHVRLEAQTVKFHIGGDVLIRFKKGDDGMLGRNIPTQSVMSFLDPDVGLPGLPPETAKVEITWRSNDIHTRLEHVNVVARDGSRLIWEYEIRPDGDAQVVPLPQLTPFDDEKPLVRPKARRDAEGEEG